jgi:iron complex outermembrane receptor protein
MKVPTVVTPARREQPLTKAPSTTTIITAEEIRRSWATSIPDLLRAVPGLDFFRASASDVNIAARGLNTRLAHRMQVFIDGRSVNLDFINLPFWHEFPISLKEIERIEIVRSPASALFSVVAFSGVIHIITKSPEALEGTHVSQSVGGSGTNITNVIHAGVADKLGYKVVFEHDRTNHFPNPPIGRSSNEKGREDFRGNVLAEYKFNDRSKASLSAGIDGFDRDIVPGLGLDFGRFFARGGLGFVKFNYSLGDFKLQSVWDRLDMDMRSRPLPPAVPVSILPKTVSVLADAFKLEAQHSVYWGNQNILTGGTSYQFSVFDAPLLTGMKRKQHFFDAFLQDEYSPIENLTFTLGVRVDTHPEAGVNVSPRASIVYSPWERHTFRASVSRAFRNPSVVENFVNLAVGPVVVKGSRGLEPEEITSYELGYQTVLFERLKARIDLFYNKLDKLSLGPLSLPANPLELVLLTGGGGSFYGGEVAFEFLFSEWLKGFVNYSYQERDVALKLLGMGPHHKGNVGLNFTLPKGFEGDVYVSTVGQSTGSPGKVDSYSLVNLRLGYQFKLLGAKGELDVRVFNLFNDRHREIPGGDIIERRITGGLQFNF